MRAELEAKLEEIEDPESVRKRQAQQLIDLEQVIPGVSVGAVLSAMEDPEAFAGIARGDLYSTLCRLREKMAHPKTSVNQMMDYAKFLAKMGKVDNPIDAGAGFASVPMISIVFPGSGGSIKIGAARAEKDVTPPRDLVTTAALP